MQRGATNPSDGNIGATLKTNVIGNHHKIVSIHVTRIPFIIDWHKKLNRATTAQYVTQAPQRQVKNSF